MGVQLSKKYRQSGDSQFVMYVFMQLLCKLTVLYQLQSSFIMYQHTCTCNPNWLWWQTLLLGPWFMPCHRYIGSHIKPVFSISISLLCFLAGHANILQTLFHCVNPVLSWSHGLRFVMCTSQCMICFRSRPSSIGKTCPNHLSLLSIIISSNFCGAVISVTSSIYIYIYCVKCRTGHSCVVHVHVIENGRHKPWTTCDDGVSPGWTRAVRNTIFFLSVQLRLAGSVIVSRSTRLCCYTHTHTYTCRHNNASTLSTKEAAF